MSDIKIKASSLFKTLDEAEEQAAQTDRAAGADNHGDDSGEAGGSGNENSLYERAVLALRTVYDPEIPVNIYDLGLIYHIDANEDDGAVYVEMTLTAPGCPVAQSFPGTVESALREVEGIEDASVKLVWDPPWTQDRMSDAVKLQLGML